MRPDTLTSFILAASLSLAGCGIQHWQSGAQFGKLGEPLMLRNEAQEKLPIALTKDEDFGLDKPLKFIKYVVPDFPPYLRRDPFPRTGRIVAKVKFAETGLVESVTPEGPVQPELFKVVVDAVSKWQIEKPMRRGRPSTFTVNVPIVFTLSN